MSEIENDGFADPAPEEQWTVWDRNAKHGTRRSHEATDGTVYALSADPREGTKMPKRHALMFLRDEAFRVVNAQGQEEVPLPLAEVIDARRSRPNLEPGHTIAKLHELTTTALQARAAQRPGGHVAAASNDRAALIKVLMEAPAIAELPRAERVRDGEYRDPDGMNDDVVQKMLAGSDADPLAMAG